jgi:uncharacterized protein
MSAGVSTLEAEARTVNVHSGALTAHACRLQPGSDLVSSIQAAAAAAASNSSPSSSAVVVLSCVGSLSSLTLRMANARPRSVSSSTAIADVDASTTSSTFRTWNEPLEIVSLVGTIAAGPNELSETNNLFHLHMAVSDETGCVYGGHFLSGTVHTTVELILGTIATVCFDRIHDPVTGYRELVVSSRTSGNDSAR